jgi:hypothetical protein
MAAFVVGYGDTGPVTNMRTTDELSGLTATKSKLPAVVSFTFTEQFAT